jgi:hypothetical protein
MEINLQDNINFSLFEIFRQFIIKEKALYKVMNKVT